MATAKRGERGVLLAYPQIVVAVGRLPVGDYLPGGGVVVERKTAADLVASIRDQRLFDQAARLRAGAAQPAIILEGDPLAVRTGMHKHAILGALTWLTTIQGIPLLPSTGPTRTAELLVTIARQQQQGWRAPTGVVKPKAPTPREQQLAVLAALPGVGPVLAVLAADVAALAAVPGVDSATAERLARLLRRGPGAGGVLVPSYHAVLAAGCLLGLLSDAPPVEGRASAAGAARARGWTTIATRAMVAQVPDRSPGFEAAG